VAKHARKINLFSNNRIIAHTNTFLLENVRSRSFCREKKTRKEIVWSNLEAEKKNLACPQNNVLYWEKQMRSNQAEILYTITFVRSKRSCV
jgi:hypothetical protein